MSKKNSTHYNLNQYEKEIEDSFNELQSISNIKEETKLLKESAKNHITKKKQSPFVFMKQI